MVDAGDPEGGHLVPTLTARPTHRQRDGRREEMAVGSKSQHHVLSTVGVHHISAALFWVPRTSGSHSHILTRLVAAVRNFRLPSKSMN